MNSDTLLQPGSRHTGRAALGVVVLLVCLAASAWAAPSSAEGGQFLALSDIHAYAPADGGPGSSATAATCPTSKQVNCPKCRANAQDTKAHLFESALQDMACNAPKPNFVIISGDWIAHHYLRAGRDATKLAIMTNLTKALQAQFGANTLLIPALGNNDAYSGDYQLEPQGQYLKDMRNLWEPLFPAEAQLGSCAGASAAEFEASFEAGGYYAFQNPHLPNNCTIVLNTVLLMQNFVGSRWGARGSEPGARQLEWLARQLHEAGERKVWLLYHVPPGVDAFGSSASYASSMFTAEFTQMFLQLMHNYSASIEAAFAGHTHLDSFRLLTKKGKPESWLHITPSITPDHHSGRSAYQIFNYAVAADNKSAVISDYTTRHMNFRDPGKAQWEEEYSWQHAFCHDGCNYDLANLTSVFDQLHEFPNDRNYRRTIELRTPSGGSPVISDSDWPKFYCAIANQTASDFTACVKHFPPGNQENKQ